MFFYTGGAGVVLGGVVMNGAVPGVAGLCDLGRRVIDPRLASTAWWAITFPGSTWSLAILFRRAAIAAPAS